MTVMVLATENEGKIGEFLALARHSGFELVSMRAAGFTGTIVEDGKTYEENALIKARTVHRRLGGWVLADDSGLSVDVLDGAPGIYSARFAGENATYPDKIAQLHAWLAPFPPETWQASFVCAIAIIQLMAGKRSCAEHAAATLRVKLRGRMDLVTIQFSFCRNMARPWPRSSGSEEPDQPPCPGAGSGSPGLASRSFRSESGSQGLKWMRSSII